jgi:hypothetical protein
VLEEARAISWAAGSWWGSVLARLAGGAGWALVGKTGSSNFADALAKPQSDSKKKAKD